MTESHHAHPVYYDLAKRYSSVKIMGPPMSQKLVDLVSHLFNLKEAYLCRHISFIYPKSIKQIVRNSGYEHDVVTQLLFDMCQKRTIVFLQNRYMLYPLIPGSFERILMTGENSGWHNKFAELINDLFNTEYLEEYFRQPINAVRNIPVQQTIEKNNYVADSDLVSELIDSHKHFGVYNSCACRQSMHMTGHTCKRAAPEDGCLGFGDYTATIEDYGNGRSVSKSEMYDIVADRWEKNLIFLTSNVQPAVPTAICTCCDCCCHALEIQNKFNRNLIAPSHFIADIDESLCVNCGRCQKVCNTCALEYNEKQLKYIPENCIGCGNCVKSCNKDAITMKVNNYYKKPPKSYTGLIMQMVPQIIRMGTKIKMNRLFR